MSELAERLAAVRTGISDAATAAGRSPEELTTIVVTKFHPASLVRELFELGVRDVGENRHQEAQAKAAELAEPELRWHFVGQLQSKKARQVRAYASVIHSIDRTALVDVLRSEETSVDCFVQLNLTDDPGRGGVAPAELEPLVEHVLATPGLRLLGLMAVAPLDEPARPAFARVRELSERVQRLAPEAGALSMGMSHDYADAIAEGATHLRIGTAITGNRPDRG
ncbi:YggS family pyridoxal phosphate-dependent enzyme [Agromyces mediolanus]|uniref:Pyridoxal phosphate homeostasis protein n=1 Tax=Agromyces mediolanus TaxID=41986 RepID=A0A918FGK1_AGRME|nr:YggS family pyridoxal phosphate-dependent enzyme [Agromyces mediolanus]MCD1572148.1 YggS family pyridoxal phosphate-dependent enzyme [Agromyces mediolanus]GGR36427.1 YggS family pyridoxal phosphate enzyme [Agromyces mediolanus]GLJ72898.1 YggS family pyridoxal phosphate enzyme [Agromyces mediolanus]